VESLPCNLSNTGEKSGDAQISKDTMGKSLILGDGLDLRQRKEGVTKLITKN